MEKAGVASASLRGARVLIVEDEYYLAEDLAAALRASSSYQNDPSATHD